MSSACSYSIPELLQLEAEDATLATRILYVVINSSYIPYQLQLTLHYAIIIGARVIILGWVWPAILIMATEGFIPVVDFKDVLSSDDLSACPQVQEIHHAFSKVGFVFLTNHGIDKELVST